MKMNMGSHTDYVTINVCVHVSVQVNMNFAILVSIVGRATLKMLRRQSKTKFEKQERNMQNAIALLNYIKRIAPQN